MASLHDVMFPLLFSVAPQPKLWMHHWVVSLDVPHQWAASDGRGINCWGGHIRTLGHNCCLQGTKARGRDAAQLLPTQPARERIISIIKITKISI